MLIKKEHYREFDFEKLVFRGERFQLPTADDVKKKPEQKKKPESPEAKQKAAEDQSPVIKSHRAKAIKQINYLIPAATTEQKPAAKKLADKWKAHATSRFNQISKEYNTQRELIGEISFDTSEQARGIEQKAVKLFKEIKKRTGPGYEKYLTHQERQDRIDAARKKTKSPKTKEAGEKEMQAVKEEIILEYLNTAEKTQGMDQDMAKMLARFIVEGNLVQLEYADLDATLYQGNVDAYFRHVDGFHEWIGGKLENKIQKAVAMFLNEAPNPEAKTKEINLFKNWILQDPTLKAQFGTSTKPDSYLMKAAKVLANKYDVRFKGGKMTHATDVTNDGGFTVYNPEDFKQHIKVELTTPNFGTPDNLKKYTEEVEGKTEDLGDLHTEIAENIFLLAKGGKIDNWANWKGHKGAMELMAKNNKVRGQVEQLEEKQNQKEREKSQREAKEAMEKGLRDTLIDAGITKERLEGFKVEREGPNFSDAEAVKLTLKLFNDKTKDKLTITVDYTKPGDAKVTISEMQAYGEQLSGKYRSLYHSVEYKPGEFKGVDLKTIVKTKEKTFLDNFAKWSQANEGLEKARKIKGLKIGYPAYHDVPMADMQKDDFKAPEATLIVKGHTVGKIVFKDGKTEKERDRATIVIDGKAQRPCSLKQLEGRLRNKKTSSPKWTR